MKTEKRFQTRELVVYRKSNTFKVVSFDTFEEAEAFAIEQRTKHPRTEKLNGVVFDTENKISRRVI